MIIGLSGKFGCGKGTVAKIAAVQLSLLGYSPYYRIYAGKLKSIVETLTSIKMVTDYDNHFIGGITDYTQEQKNIFIEEFGMTIGQMLQYIGTELFRDKFDEYTWVKALFREWDLILSKDPTAVLIIPDTRFPNEANTILDKYHGWVIRVNSNTKHGIENSHRNPNHKSETSLDDYNRFTYTITNDSNINDLKDTIKTIIDRKFKE